MEVNEYSAEVVAARLERFRFFATVTLPGVQVGLAEAQYALDILLADEIVMLANSHGRYLGDPGFEPLLQFLHHRRAVVVIHPGELPAPAVPGIPTCATDFSLQISCSTPLALLSAWSRPVRWRSSRESSSSWPTRAVSCLTSTLGSC